MTSYTQAVVDRALNYVGVIETTHNSSSDIDRWLASVHLMPGDEWCMASLFGWFNEVAIERNVLCPVPRTGSVIHAWATITDEHKYMGPLIGRAVFMDHGGGKGHTGLVVAVGRRGYILTVEGNTNRDGSRLGDSVWCHVWNPSLGARGKLLGYADFSI